MPHGETVVTAQLTELGSRRELLRHATAASTIGILMVTGGCESLINAIKNRPTRRSFGSLAPTDPLIDAYKAAVSAMKALPASDPRSWSRQAKIHDDFCPHGNWYFLPWHRAYLLYFERLCREFSGMQSFALPYWNWSTDPSIPAAFWGAGNPLLDTTRTVGATDELSAEFVGGEVMEEILSEPDFFLFASGKSSSQRGPASYGRLEATPHNNVHGFIGGNMLTYLSPLDPVFWAHHNMVERCWVDWNLERGHFNTNDGDWVDFVFAGNFVDPSGASVDVKVFDTFFYPVLAYQYDDYALGSNMRMATIRDTEALKKLAQRGAPAGIEFRSQFETGARLTVRSGERASSTVRVDRTAFAPAFEGRRGVRVLLELADVSIPASGDFFVRVFLDKPEADARTPIDDPHYVGSFAFFGGDHAGHHAESSRPSYFVDATNAVRRLSVEGGFAPGDQFQVQLVAVPVRPGTVQRDAFELGRLKIGIAALP
jgi:tyrosinase